MSENTDTKKEQFNVYLRFSTVAIQMGAIITAGALGGQWLDSYYQLEFPIFTLCLSLLCVGFALYLVIREVLKMSKDKENE